MEDAGWLKRMNDLPHARRCYQVTQEGAAQVIPADVRAILRDPHELKADQQLTLYPDPDDDTLLIGSNGHRYAAARPPGRAGWQHELAYQVLDRLRPSVLPVNCQDASQRPIRIGHRRRCSKRCPEIRQAALRLKSAKLSRMLP
jgi:hypothetical protein